MQRQIGGHVSIAGGLPNGIARAQEIQANCLQIFTSSPRTWAQKQFTSQEVTQFKQQVKDNSLSPVFIHALYLINLVSDNSDTVRKSVAALKAELQAGEQLSAKGVIVHTGWFKNTTFDMVKSQLVERLQEILTVSNSVYLLLENAAGEPGRVGELQQLSELVHQINHPQLGVCLDTAHLWGQGYDLTSPKKVDQLVNYLSELKILKHIHCLHINDSQVALGSGKDRHQNIGEGTIGNTGIKNFITHPQLDHLPLILEVPGHDKSGPDLANIKRLRSLLQD